MTDDARFEDGVERPLRLKALEAADLEVISALVQDAIFPDTEMRYDRKARRFALLVNRFRWEDAEAATQRGRAFERVQAVLVVENVLHVRSQGLTAGASDRVLSLLSIEWHAGDDAAGRVTLNLAGDGAIALEVEALEVLLKDVTRPYLAPSGRQPDHRA